jgi:hypothetical protein
MLLVAAAKEMAAELAAAAGEDVRYGSQRCELALVYQALCY